MIEYLLSAAVTPLVQVLPEAIFTGWIFVSIVCRFGKMGRETSSSVAWQYAALFSGCLGAFLLQFVPQLSRWSLTTALIGVVVFLALSSKRWRRGAPDGTRKLRRLSEDQLHQVVGGKGGT
jgi:hypothetical protein